MPPKLKCLNCNDDIESTEAKKYVMCLCGNVSIRQQKNGLIYSADDWHKMLVIEEAGSDHNQNDKTQSAEKLAIF